MTKRKLLRTESEELSAKNHNNKGMRLQAACLFLAHGSEKEYDKFDIPLQAG